MKISKGILTLLIISAAIPAAYGITLYPGAQYTYLGVGAKEAALGYTGISSPGGMSGMWFNPAALGDLRRLANSFGVAGFGTSQFLGELGF
ncbi:MAG: hypothetical protein HPY53_06575, partial [Brevinematales bacterium]|nr:hypothetical protein [Brevinematales bacterium]